MPMIRWRDRVLEELTSLFLRSSCPLCGRSAEQAFCSSCQRQLQRCQLPNPCQNWRGDLPVFAWGNYGGTLKRAIAALKYENHPKLAQPLGHELGKAWLDVPQFTSTQKMIVTPIPIHPKKIQQRGFNQAELLGRSFCQFTGLPFQPLGLERTHQTEAQFGLGMTAREENLKHAFSLGKGFRRCHPVSPVLLLDDIYTTGATARSAAQALRQRGIAVLGIVAITRTMRNN